MTAPLSPREVLRMVETAALGPDEVLGADDSVSPPGTDVRWRVAEFV